jgi:hypothetical protein
LSGGLASDGPFAKWYLRTGSGSRSRRGDPGCRILISPSGDDQCREISIGSSRSRRKNDKVRLGIGRGWLTFHQERDARLLQGRLWPLLRKTPEHASHITSGASLHVDENQAAEDCRRWQIYLRLEPGCTSRRVVCLQYLSHFVRLSKHRVIKVETRTRIGGFRSQNRGAQPGMITVASNWMALVRNAVAGIEMRWRRGVTTNGCEAATSMRRKA